jgi:hypothetical protein
MLHQIRNVSIKLKIFEQSEKVFAFGKFRLRLVGLRLHFPAENRQSRFFHSLATSDW